MIMLVRGWKAAFKCNLEKNTKCNFTSTLLYFKDFRRYCHSLTPVQVLDIVPHWNTPLKYDKTTNVLLIELSTVSLKTMLVLLDSVQMLSIVKVKFKKFQCRIKHSKLCEYWILYKYCGIELWIETNCARAKSSDWQSRNMQYNWIP